MARKKRSHVKHHKGRARSSAPPPPALAPPPEKKAPVQYGKPFTLLEDADKNTFEFKAGAWVPYPMTIAECRAHCQVNELPQKVNYKTRYEVRCPVTMDV